jgi:hypothetical protein
LSTARLIARNPEALNQAMIDFNCDVYAKGSADVRESRIATMETIAADVGMMLFPLQEESLVPVLAVLKAAALPREQDSIEDAPVHLFGAVGVGFWWLQREIEASALVTKQAAVLLDEIMGDQVAQITLGVTKTDTVGKGVFRRHACGCAAHGGARWKSSSSHFGETSVVDLYVEEAHAERRPPTLSTYWWRRVDADCWSGTSSARWPGSYRRRYKRHGSGEWGE